MNQKKQCLKCGEEKPLEEFSKNVSTNDGFERWCKDCKKAQMQIYRDKRAKQKSDNGPKHRRMSKPKSVPKPVSRTDEAILIPPEAIKAIQRAVAKQIINIIERAFA